ncbi:DivIVA domain-containing protein [Candidatus Aerophobetes bacterium]|nr:DivIVA domain-containing protein [Candidatus Aerophobetes bacterium]
MSYEKEFRISFKGYNRREVDEFINKIKRDYKKAIEENKNLHQEIKRLKEEIEKYKSNEEKIKDALISAQESSKLINQSSQEKAQLIIKNAEIRAEKIIKKNEEKLKKIKEEINRLHQQKILFLAKMRSLLTTHSEILDLYEEKRKKSPLPHSKKEITFEE